MENLHITNGQLAQWLDDMRRDGLRIFAPVAQGGKTDFKFLAEGDTVAEGYVQTAQSAKRIVLPMAEVLFSYRKHGKQEKSLSEIRNMYGSYRYATRTNEAEEPEALTA